MACTPLPTSTLFGSSEFVSNSISQSISTTVSTLPPSTITTTTTSCPDTTVSSSVTCTIQIVSSIIPGTTTTITDRVPITIPVTLTSTFPTETLFSTCPPNQPAQSPPNTVSEPTSSSSSQSISTSASQSTLPGGQLTTVTSFSSVPPQTITVPPSPGLNNGGSNSNTSNSNLAPIIGGVLGGFFGLLLFAGAFICWRRKRRWDDIYEKESNHGIDDDYRPVQAPEPAPYHYGLVGHHRNPSASPPSSPTSRPVTFHSRVESSGGVSIVSRESTVPLNISDSLAAPPDVHRAPAHSRRPSQGNEGLLLMRPLEPASQAGTLMELGRRSLTSNSSNPSGSVSSSGQPHFPLRVTNTDEAEGGPSQGQSSQAGVPKLARRKTSQSTVLVHVDGGRLEGGVGTEMSTPEDNPPAYSKSG